MITRKTDSQAKSKRRKGRSNVVFDTFIRHTFGVNKMPQYLNMN